MKETVEMLGKTALAYAQAGADMVAPSDQMDARIGYIKNLLDENGLKTPVMSYGAKFKSSLYGPFRDACDSAPSFGDRSKYQFPIGSKDVALRAILRDVEEGADIVMVKPGVFYLDIIAQIA